MVNKTRQQAIKTLTKIQTEIKILEQKLREPLVHPKTPWLTDVSEQLRQIKIKKLCVESQISTWLPIEVEGFFR